MMKKILGLLLALAMAGAALFALPANVTGQAEPLDWVVGTGWYFGETVNFDELQDEIDQGLQDLPPGFDANVNVAGGIGTYFGIEVVDDDADVNGYTCYQVDISGAVGIDFGMDASIDGTYSDQGMSIDVDASGNAIIMGEANLLISLYFTDDIETPDTEKPRHLVKAEAEFTAEANADVSVDAVVDMDLGGLSGIEGFDSSQHFDVSADLTAEAKGVRITGSILFDPPLDFFAFPIYEGDVWWVPESGTQVTTTWSAQGTIDVTADITGIPNEPDVHEHETLDLAVEIGSGTDGPMYIWDQTMFECVAVYGNNYIIETSTGEFINFFDWGGTRQYGMDYLDMLPVDDLIPVENAGVQYNADEGFITGLSIDGEVQTTTSDEATVNNFAADPLGEVQETTGGHGSVGDGGSAILPLLILGIIVVVVVLVVVAMMANKGKKKKQGEMYGAPPPQQPAPYQQPPPPQQYPPQQPPPPPPPTGQ